MTNRKEILANIIKQAELNKQAEDIVDDINLADISDSKEYANKIFEQLLNNIMNNIKIEGLD